MVIEVDQALYDLMNAAELAMLRITEAVAADTLDGEDAMALMSLRRMIEKMDRRVMQYLTGVR